MPKDFYTHNIRFYEFCPEAIHCIAYNDDLRSLALSRADGSIELWNCHYKPFKQQTIFGSKKSSVESLVWCGNRLFSSGLDGFILEYDSTTYLVKNQVAVTGGPTWCLALSPNKKLLAAGSEAGYVCIFNVTEEGLEYNKILKKQESRVISIGWGDDSEHLVTGSVNFVHLISITTEKVLQFSVGKTGKKETIVWCVALLPDKTIITGDSRGLTNFYDGKFGTLINSTQTHKADVLTMQVTPESKSVFVAGVDPVIVEVCLVDTGAKQGRRMMWVKSVHRRFHTHDIRSLALTQEGKLFSGGVDTDLVLSFFPPKTVIKYPATPPRGYISLAEKSHKILLGYKNKLELWDLGICVKEPSTDKYVKFEKDRVRYANIELSENSFLECCAVSPNAQWIACTSKGKLIVYTFTKQKNNAPTKLTKVFSKSPSIQRSSQLVWIQEGILVSATYSDVLQILAVKKNEVYVERTICLPSKGMARQIVSLESSYLAVLDTTNQVTVFSLKERKPNFVVMPKTKFPVTALALGKNEEIIIAYSNMRITEYDIKEAFCTSFGKELLNNPYNEIIKSNSVIDTISFFESRIFMHSVSSFYVINKNPDKELSTPRPQKVLKYESGVDTESNDSTSSVKVSSNGKLFTVSRSNHVLFYSHVDEDELISVELDPITLFNNLPPMLKVKKYGAG